MKRYAMVAILAVLFLLPAGAFAADTVSVTGEVVDSACYIKMGAKGDAHRECAQKCADAGIPLAILEDGSNKVIWLASAKDVDTPNKQLRQHAAQKVTVTGSWAERGGAKILVVESVKPAGK